MDIPNFCPSCGAKVRPETTRLCTGSRLVDLNTRETREVVTIYCLACKKLFTIEDITADVEKPDDLAWDR